MTNTKLDFEQRQQAERMAENGDQLDQCFELVAARAEIARLQKREIQFGVALMAVMEVVQKDSPQWMLADQLWRMLNHPAPAHEPCEQPAVCKGPPPGCPYIYCHSNLVCQYAVKSEGAPRGAGSPGLIQRVCHALTDNCVMFTDPERQPCTPENCAAMRASTRT